MEICRCEFRISVIKSHVSGCKEMLPSLPVSVDDTDLYESVLRTQLHNNLNTMRVAPGLKFPYWKTATNSKNEHHK